ncbi:MAG: hypothetical protein QGI87_06885, partial [Candidatus Bathyarchaeota archaeon]|nr:hypothetical protein [Candidatus Bathyarchaeota archaeon]
MVVFFASVDFRVYQVHGHETYMEVIQLTDNDYDDTSPQIHDGQVTWHGSDGSDYEIYLYDGSSVTQLTNNEYTDYTPQIHD